MKHKKLWTAGLLLSLNAATASANPLNSATYSVALTVVQAPNTGPATYLGASDNQTSLQPRHSSFVPVMVQTGGGADTGPNHDGYGFANGSAFARAEAGILKVSAFAEADVVAQPSTNVGASARSLAQAQFNDKVTFTAPNATSNLIVSGSLLLDGWMDGSGGFAQITVGGTGIGPSFGGNWVADSGGLQKSAYGKYSTFIPGTQIAIPFTFSVVNGLATELSYFMEGIAQASANFGACPATGGLCDVVELAGRTANLDYSHTLVWGGVTVTDFTYGNVVNFTNSSTSGFNYADAYGSSIPVPAAIWLFGTGLIGLLGLRRRGNIG